MSTTSRTPALRRDKQLAMWRRAMRSMPGGTNSNFRAWGEDTIYIDRGQGGGIWDMDGNEYIDLRMGYGPGILGRGTPGAVPRTIIPARYNEMEGRRRIFEREGDDIAAIIVEPVLGNAQGIL